MPCLDDPVNSTISHAASAVGHLAQHMNSDSTTTRHDTLEVASEAARLRTYTRTIRQHRRSHSRLDRYAHELLALADAGCITAELPRWLAVRRVAVQHSTVTQRLRRHGG